MSNEWFSGLMGHQGDLPDLTLAFAQFDAVKADLKASPDDARLKRKFKAMSLDIRKAAAFVRMTPESDSGLLDQMFRDEKVHKLPHFEDFIKTRIAAPGMGKGSFALAATDKGTVRGLAAIYTYYDLVSAGLCGVVHSSALRGDIHAVKNEIPAAVPAGIIPNAVYFYTVTSKFPGSGPTMVQSVGAAHSAFLKATISPIREFTNGRDMEGFEFLPRSCRTRLVADYLAVRDGFSGMDSVAFFHMGNGAYAGCVQFNPGQPDDRVMMNYIYSNNEDAVRENQQIFKAGYVPMARELFEFLSPDLKPRVAPVDVPLVAPNPAHGLGYDDLTP